MKEAGKCDPYAEEKQVNRKRPRNGSLTNILENFKNLNTIMKEMETLGKKNQMKLLKMKNTLKTKFHWIDLKAEQCKRRVHLKTTIKLSKWKLKEEKAW